MSLLLFQLMNRSEHNSDLYQLLPELAQQIIDQNVLQVVGVLKIPSKVDSEVTHPYLKELLKIDGGSQVLCHLGYCNQIISRFLNIQSQ